MIKGRPNSIILIILGFMDQKNLQKFKYPMGGELKKGGRFFKLATHGVVVQKLDYIF